MSDLNSELNVLIIDDSHLMVMVMKTVLKKLGYEKITEAVDGEDGLNKIKETQYDLILLDWHMPKLHGRDFLAAARGMNEYKEIPIIVVTAENLEENKNEAFGLGASEFLIKPFKEDALHEKLEAVFANPAPEDAASQETPPTEEAPPKEGE